MRTTPAETLLIFLEVALKHTKGVEIKHVLKPDIPFAKVHSS